MGEWELQVAVNTALNADATLSALVTGVYDFVDKDASLPYVTIGDDTASWEGSMGVDWSAARINIHSWAYGEGRKSVLQIMDAIFNVLHKGSLTIDGKTHVKTLMEFTDTFLEDDGTYHGVQRFKVIFHEPF